LKYPKVPLGRFVLPINHSTIYKKGEISMNKGDLVNEVAEVVCTKKEAQEVVGR